MQSSTRSVLSTFIFLYAFSVLSFISSSWSWQTRNLVEYFSDFFRLCLIPPQPATSFYFSHYDFFFFYFLILNLSHILCRIATIVYRFWSEFPILSPLGDQFVAGCLFTAFPLFFDRVYSQTLGQTFVAFPTCLQVSKREVGTTNPPWLGIRTKDLRLVFLRIYLFPLKTTSLTLLVSLPQPSLQTSFSIHKTQ